MATSEEIRDLEFMVSEIMRFLKHGPELLKSSDEDSKYDFLCHIPKPQGGFLVWGREAERRLRVIADRHVARHRTLVARIEPDTAYRAFKLVLSRLLLTADREIDAQLVDKLIGRSISHIKRECLSDRIHYIPCNLVGDETPSSFEVGPVTFVRAQQWLTDNQEKLQEDMDREVLVWADEEGRNFHWLGVVTVEQCDKSISQERAYLAVEAAIDVLRLYLPINYSTKFRSIRRWRDHRLWHGFVFENGRVGATFERSYLPLGGEAWRAFLDDADGIRLVSGAAIHGLVKPGEFLPLRQRFLDALRWFGDGCEEESRAASIVKWAAAIERLTMPRKLSSDISETVVARAAKLVELAGFDERDSAAKALRQLYSYRSEFMHGSRSPFNLFGTKGIAELFAITQSTIRAAVPFYFQIRKGGGSERELDNAFNYYCGC